MNNRISIIIYYNLIDSEARYWVAATNEDCQIQNIIKTEAECIVAAEHQQRNYKRSLPYYVTYPAGCFIIATSGNIYFNTNIDPSSTSPSKGAGLCFKGNIWNRLGFIIHLKIILLYLEYV